MRAPIRPDAKTRFSTMGGSRLSFCPSLSSHHHPNCPFPSAPPTPINRARGFDSTLLSPRHIPNHSFRCSPYLLFPPFASFSPQLIPFNEILKFAITRKGLLGHADLGENCHLLGAILMWFATEAFARWGEGLCLDPRHALAPSLEVAGGPGGDEPNELRCSHPAWGSPCHCATRKERFKLDLISLI